MNLIDHQVIGYERVVEATDDTGFHAIVAIHNTNLGVALGGCRVKEYADRGEQLKDVLALSKGMTYKAALAGLPLGGGKATINAPKADPLTLTKFALVMDYINKDGIQYITAGDIGTGPQEVALLARLTEFVNGQHLGEDSGYATAYGVYMAMMGALNFHNRDIRKQSVGIMGLGKVGMRLNKFLHREAKSVFVMDPDEEAKRKAVNLYGSTRLPDKESLLRNSTIYSPNALGGDLCTGTLGMLTAGDIVCGGANNQFYSDGLDVAYAGKGITVVPDYLANAGGIIIVKEGMKDGSYRDPDVMEKLKGVMHTTEEVLWRAREEKHTPMFIANKMAEERFNV